MRKVLIVPTLGLDLEGITTVIYNYIHAMDPQGLQFHFMTYGELKPVLRQRFEAMGALEFVSDRKKRTLDYIRDYIHLLKNGSFDVVHIHGNSSTMAIEAVLAKLCGVSRVMVHTHSTKTSYPFINAVLKYPMMLCADRRIACSRSSGDWLYKNWSYTVLNNAIDLPKFCFDASVREQYRVELGVKDKLVVGHIGHFSAPKNHLFLVDIFDAFHKLRPNAKLLLVSDGPDFEAVVEKVHKLQLQESVIFTGRRPDVDKLYQAMDIFLMPSRWEGLPLVLLEAQTSGLPVVASDRITKDVRCTENFWYLNIEDSPETWAQKLLEVADTGGKRSADTEQLLRERGFDIHLEAERLRELYLK